MGFVSASTPRSAVTVRLSHTPPPAGSGNANDNRPQDVRLDQYYTDPPVAAWLYAIFCQHFDPTAFRMVEPSAGDGSFSRLLPIGSLAFDVDPRRPDIQTADFLTVRLPDGGATAFIGNPPFGRNASLAARFFNHAAQQGDVIAFIVPRSFRKGSIENRLDRSFHLVREVDVPRNAFFFQGRPFHVPAVFQIWERRPFLRALRLVETWHPDFEFTMAALADFAIQRVGARAGRVHHDLGMSPSSHYFIRGPVEATMRQLDLATLARDVAGNPSLSKSEIVAAYRALTEQRAAA